MKVLSRFIEGKKENIQKNSVIWNMIASLEYSLQSALLILVITRVGGLKDAGIFTIAYTITQMMSTIGSYGMRSFQSSDVLDQYKFETYFTSRIVSTFVMIVATIVYAVMHGCTGNKMVLVVILCIYRTVDVLEDVYQGHIQKKDRLDIASKCNALRIFISTVLFGIVFCFTKDLVLASIAFSFSTIFVFVVLNHIANKSFDEIHSRFEFKGVISLMWVCLPICVGGFLYNYLVNAPKYAIDRLLSDELQTIFNILFMPVFVINLLSSFIFKPLIVKMSLIWSKGKKKELIKMVAIQSAVIVVLTAVIAVAGGVLGLDLLELFYGVDLSHYRMILVVLLMFGGIAAVSAYYSVVLTIVRMQKFIIISYVCGLICNFIMIDRLVKKYEILGASLSYGLSVSIVVITMIIGIVLSMRKRRENI